LWLGLKLDVPRLIEALVLEFGMQKTTMRALFSNTDWLFLGRPVGHVGHAVLGAALKVVDARERILL
jgi:hypothetical protein